MKFETLLARRYMFSGRHKALASLFTLIAFGGITLGVFALIVVIAVMEGFDRNLTAKIIGAEAHITITQSIEGANNPIIAEEELPKVLSVPGIKAAAPVIMRLALIMTRDEETDAPAPGGPSSPPTALDPNDPDALPDYSSEDSAQTDLTRTRRPPRQAGLLIQGLDLATEPRITDLMLNVNGTSMPEGNDLVVGHSIATQQLMTTPGQRLLVIGSTFAETPDGPMPTMRNSRMVGVFQTGYPESDNFMAYTSLEGARRLFRIEDGRVDGIRAVVHDAEKVGEIQAELRRVLGPGRLVITWQDRNAVLFQALKLEKWALFVILMIVVLIAAFNIIGTLTLVVTEKTREIGILKSMGADERIISRIFVNQGMIIGGLGTIFGTLTGLGTCWLLEHVIRIPGVTAAYFSDRIPVHVNWSIVALTVVCSLLISLVAAWFPARQAARLDPVEALRHD
jgi:lipoprotein-releasing system permease protein